MAWGADDYFARDLYAPAGNSIELRATETTHNGAIVQIPHVIARNDSTAASALQTATGTNADSVITIAAAGAGVSNVIEGVSWSYGSAGTLAGGRITIKDGSTVVFDADITAAGAGFFRPFRKGTANTAMTITLYAGGSTVVGKVNVDRAWTE